MRIMDIEAITPKPNTSRPEPGHPVYPYLLRGLTIDRPNQVWATDITYIPLAHGSAYLVAIIDWYSRRVLSSRLSNTLDSAFCVEALEEALSRFGQPEIFNTDQGSQLTAADFTSVLLDRGVKISMDGKGRCIDNATMERFTTDGGNSVLSLAQWRSTTGQDMASFTSDPATLFVAPGGANYHLSAPSPARDTGQTRPEVTEDLEGTPRPQGPAFDIGAYEYAIPIFSDGFESGDTAAWSAAFP
jgi:hypothetical protein